MAILIGFKPYVLNAYAALVGEKPGYAALQEHLQFIAAPGVGVTGYKAALEGFFGSTPTATLAASLLTNLGLGGSFSQAQAEAFLDSNPNNRVGAIIDLAQQLYSYAGTDAALMAAKVEYAAKIDNSNAYSSNASNVNGEALGANAGQTLSLTTGFDSLIGTAFADTFMARIVDNSNTAQSGDKINGGGDFDHLHMDVGNSQDFAISLETLSVEHVTVRAQTVPGDSNNNNMLNNVQIDAQRMDGVTLWESSNSRSDVVIEDVRIQASQITKDITIAMVETDPGNVDFGVYFDQLSLRNSSTSSSQLNLQVMDTRSVVNGTDPLLNSPYGGFRFTATNTATGETAVITLQSAAIDDAQTYAELAAAFQVALDARFTPGSVTAVVGANFTVTDTTTGTLVTGQEIKISTAGAFSFTTPAGSGWIADGVVPANSGLHTNFNTAASTSTELVTSKIILDDVGRGSTGGDLVVGGLSVGDTSNSKGVERFEIEVRDNSKLQTINSTNNTLREVVIVNGVTTSQSNAFVTTVKDAGKLTVNGDVNDEVFGDNINIALPGTTTQHNDFGFSDVRLIDASAMRGDVGFTAEVTDASIAKYLNLRDTAANPAADNVTFAYSTGAGNDTMSVTIDGDTAASKTLTGQADFVFTMNGGNGNDTITTNIGGNETAAWLADQKSNANITIDGGAGNDTITTAGAGAVIINAGTGNDTVYTDNTGAKATWVVNDLAPALTADLWTAGSGGAGFLYGGKLTVSLSGAALGGGVMAAIADASAGTTADPYTNGLEVTVDIPTGANFVVSQLYINQAIKKAINDDAVLSKLLTATDGPSNTLTITSKIDGTFAAADLKMTITAADLTGLTAGEQGVALAAYKIVSANSAAVIANAQTANALTVTTGNGVAGMDVNQILGTTSGSNVGFAVAVTTQGVTQAFEVQTIDVSALIVAVNETITFNVDGTPVGYTNLTAGALTGDALEADIVSTVVAAIIGGSTYTFTNAAAGLGDLTLTQSVAGKNIADVTADWDGNGVGNDATGAATTEGAAPVAEVFTVTVTGQALQAETITIDSTATSLAVGDTAATIAANIVGAASGTYGIGAVAGNVVTFTANAVGVVPDAVVTSNIPSVLATGSISTAESDNTINLGSGNDVLVLGTGLLSNDTVVFTGTDIGKNTIVNFADAAGTNADMLDFTSYLVGKSSLSGSVDSQVRIGTSLNADATVEANSVTVISTAVFTATDTFAGLTGAKLLTAINTTGSVAFANINDATLDATNTYIGTGAGTTLVGGVGQAIVMVENDANEGEYAVFELTFNGLAANTTAAFTAATLLGTVDFGNSVDGLLVSNLA